MGQLCEKYIKLLSADEAPSERFWKLEKRIKQDRRHPGVMIQLEKSETYWNIALLLKKGVINERDLDGFSEDLIEAVKMILSR